MLSSAAAESATPLATDFVLSAAGEGRHVHRAPFDAAVAAAAERAGATVVRGAFVTRCQRTALGWRVTAGAAEYSCRWLIDAAGRAGRLTRRVALDRQDAVYARLTRVTTTDQRLLVEATAGGWWYFAPLPGGCGIAAWMTDADLLPARPLILADEWADQLARTTLIRNAPAGAIPATVRVVRAGMAVARAC